MNQYRKAILAALTSAAAAFTGAIADGQMSGPDWALVVAAFVVGGTSVWAIPNAPKPVPDVARHLGAKKPAGQ